jgi:glycosyltransferase involved in cell wall biosynthesis
MLIQTPDEVIQEDPQARAMANTADVARPDHPSGTINVLYVVDQLSALGGGERAMIRIIEAHSTRFRCRVLTFREDVHPEVKKRLSIPIHVIPLVRTHSVEGLLAARALRKLILSERIDIVHTFFETSDLFAGLVAKLAGVKVLISSRRDMGLLRSRKHQAAYRLMGPAFTRVLAVSEAVRKQVLAVDRLAPSQVTTLYTGISPQRQHPVAIDVDIRRKIGIPAGAPVVLNVANILPWKGHCDFLRAAALVHQKIPDAHFVVAGSSNGAELFATLLLLRESLGMGHCFHFLGEVDYVSSLYRTASVFCLLSQTEGLPNVVLEAMAAGLPVVATNTGGTGEVVVDAKTGFLTEVGQPNEAAEFISTLLLSPDLARNMSQSARDRIKSVFSMDRMMSTLEGIYESSLVL